MLVNLKMKLPCNTLVIVGSSFPTAKDMFGDPRIDEVPFFTMGTLRDEETEEEIIGKVSSLGFHYLNIARFLSKNVFRGMTTEHGWESVIVRYTTFLLLTHIAKSLLIKTPNRVNQDMLHKAVSSGNEETELYNNLLMKRANNWMLVKSKSLNDVMDLTASNAYEITQMLWKIYHRSRSHSSPRRTSGSKNRCHHRKEKKCKGYGRKTSSSPKPGSSKGEKGGKGRSRNSATASSESLMKDSPPFDVNQGCKETKCVERAENSAQKDEESLEEGEIPESPSGSPKERRLIQDDTSNKMFSDVSSSEGEFDIPNISSASFERIVVPVVGQHHQYYQHYPAPYHNYQNYQIQVPTYCVAHHHQQIQCLDLTSNEPVISIEVSDEEPVQEEKLNDYDANEAIINLNSEEESWDNKSLPNERIELRQHSPQKEIHKERSSKYGGKDKLRLIIAEGMAISWPSDKRQDTLWKWWRSHIQNNNGLMVLCHSGIGKIHGAIPSLCGKKGTCIAVPKIVDDMQQFLTCLGKTEFPEYCIDLNENEKCKNSNEKSVKTAKLLPLAEELSRGSVKRVNFEISKKKITSVSARITVKEFASVRSLTAKTRRKSDLDILREPKTSYSSEFYSYGEKMSSSSMPSNFHAHLPPLGHWFTNSKTETGKSEAKSSKILTEISEFQKIKNSSSESDRRRGKMNSSTETGSKRRRERTSSSSDRSDSRDRSLSERH